MTLRRYVQENGITGISLADAKILCAAVGEDHKKEPSLVKVLHSKGLAFRTSKGVPVH